MAEVKKDGVEQRDIALLGLGQACQNIVLECLSHELHAHQFGGFIREQVNKICDIDTARFFLSHIIAVGKTSEDVSWMPLEKLNEEKPNFRKPLSDFIREISL